MQPNHHDFLLSGLNPEQQEVVLHNEGPCLVSAVAGSGKTRSLVHRIAYLILVRGIPGKRILATTFTKKAAGEMKTRLAKLVGSGVVDVRTFHSLAAQILRADFYGYEHWDLNDSKAEMIVKDACGYQHLDIKRVDIQQVKSFIGLCKADMASPESPRAAEIAENLVGETRPHDMIEAYAKSEELRVAARVFTFDDWLVEVVKLFDASPEIAGRWAEKFDYVLQDEANDQSLVQARIIKHLVGGHRNYMALGDVGQCMYSFRGARPELLVGFEKEWQSHVISMSRNYRSGKSIIELANHALLSMDPTQRLDVLIDAEREIEGHVSVSVYADQEDEADQIVQRMMAAHEDGVPWNHNVVLYRTNSLSRATEEALIKAKVPYKIFGGVNFFERKEVKDVLSYMRLASKRGKIKDARRCINRPNRFLGRQFLERMEEEARKAPAGGWMEIIENAAHSAGIDRRRKASAEQWVYTLREIQSAIFSPDPGRPELSDPDNIVMKIVRDTKYAEWIRKEEGRETIENDRISNIAELARAAGKFSNVIAFLDHVDQSIEANKEASKEDDMDIERVHLMSVHRSKVLEYPNVFLITCNDGVMPHIRGNPEEEKRIFYVAVTRAMERLYISCVKIAVSNGSERVMFPSRRIKHLITSEHPSVGSDSRYTVPALPAPSNVIDLNSRRLRSLT